MDAQLPTLSAGVTYLDDRGAPAALYRLIGNHLAEVDGPAYWLDARNAAVPGAIRQHAVGRTAETLQVARAFTGYQHYELVRELPETVSSRTALVVAPNLAALYAEDDVPEEEADAMFAATLSILEELASALSVPIVLTSERNREQIRAVADRVLEADRTREGLRFDGSDFGTDVYWHPWGYQTTIPYWVELLGAVEAAGERDVAMAADPAVPGV